MTRVIRLLSVPGRGPLLGASRAGFGPLFEKAWLRQLTKLHLTTAQAIFVDKQFATALTSWIFIYLFIFLCGQPLPFEICSLRAFNSSENIGLPSTNLLYPGTFSSDSATTVSSVCGYSVRKIQYGSESKLRVAETICVETMWWS